jgi:4-amino-4-deoxy-L-arabinose transferase-like glycosyltransferase
MTITTPERAAAPYAERAGRGRATRLLRGPADDPSWARPALLALLAVNAVLHLWDLGASGNANSFYAAAVQAGTQSWKAMLFGSFDSANAITVDKPPFFLWPMEIAGRMFGFNSWSMLVPQALEGVAAVGLVAATVRRTSGHAAGLLAGAALAATPVAALMFRFNNPDAMLTLLLAAGAYTTVRAVRTASTPWLALTGVLVGSGFITKMGQALLVVPGLALAYLIAAPVSLRRRIGQLLLAGGAMVAGAGWWIAIVELWPASSRPYIGGSTTNSVLELAFGYNGLGRILGGQGNGGGGGGRGGGMANGGFGGATGLTRMFSSDMATEISWLLPTALLSLAIGLWATRRAARTDLTRAALVMWGGWLLVTGLVFSYMQGTIHPYYTVALAPAVAALVAMTARILWQTRDRRTSRVTAAVLVAVTAGWDFHLLAQTPTWFPAVRYLLVAAAAVAIVGLLAGPRLRQAVTVLVAVVCIAGLGGSATYAVDTAGTAHAGSIPASGPAGAGGTGGMGGPGAPGGTPPTGGRLPSTGPLSSRRPSMDGSGSVSSSVVSLLRATTTRWAAATVGSQTAGSLELASGTAVMSIGGFNGGDPAPTLAQFQQYVDSAKIHYFIGTGSNRGGGPGGSGNDVGAQITAWVAAHYTATTVGGLTVYDLTG